jgi:SHS2 domain-containing protein
MRPCTRQIAHVADVKLALHADTMEALFGEAARFLARYGGRPTGAGFVALHVRLQAPDASTLLADWINELLGRSEIDRTAYTCRRVSVDTVLGQGVKLEADLVGTPVRDWRCPLKAATYHDLRLEYRRGRWRAQVLCDA